MDYAGRVETLYVCGCGWRREFTDTPEWKNKHIQHPVWGEVTQYTAVLMDVKWHDCVLHHLAQRHAPRQHEIPVNYEVAEAQEESGTTLEDMGISRSQSRTG